MRTFVSIATLVIFSLMIAGPIHAQTISFDAVSSPKLAFNSCSNGTNSVKWSHTTSGNNRLLLAQFTVRNSQKYAVSSVTYDNQPLTLLDSQEVVDSNSSIKGLKTYVFYKIAPNTGGAKTVSVKFTGYPPYAEIMCNATSWTNVHQTTPFGPVAKKAKSGYFMNDPVNLNVESQTGDVVVDTLSKWGDTSDQLVPGSGQTARFHKWAFTNLSHSVSQKDATPPSTNMTWSDSFIAWDLWTHIGFALKPNSASSSSTSQIEATPSPIISPSPSPSPKPPKCYKKGKKVICK